MMKLISILAKFSPFMIPGSFGFHITSSFSLPKCFVSSGDLTSFSGGDASRGDKRERGFIITKPELAISDKHNHVSMSVWATAVLTTSCFAPLAHAVSGGGLDYAGIDISNQDFSGASYKGKDFTQVIAKNTKFIGSNLQGCRFYKAYLVDADFTNADVRGASFEDTSMDNASLKGAVASGTYFGASILDVSNLENADFTDAQLPVKVLPKVCERDDLKGTNPTTGVDTRESLMCL
mmetsp:Transcript_23223/g.32693  ORF Transcript_23223/g.32693 Transcript_23223/m.32693 type:complete len:236 (-) Transcript_23223:124-831(-)